MAGKSDNSNSVEEAYETSSEGSFRLVPRSRSKGRVRRTQDYVDPRFAEDDIPELNTSNQPDTEETEVDEQADPEVESVQDADPVSVGVSSATRSVPEPSTSLPADFTCTSILSRSHVGLLMAKYFIPDDLDVFIPDSNDRAHDPPVGRLPVYEDQLKGGLRFPLHKLFKSVLNHWELSLAQLAPNAFRQMSGFIIYCKYYGITPSLSLFRHFFLIRVTTKDSGQFYFANRPKVATLVKNSPSSIKNWKKKFFFVNSAQVGVARPWNPSPSLSNDKPSASEINDKSIKILSNLGRPLDIDSISENMLSFAGISAAPLPKAYHGRGKFSAILSALRPFLY